MNELELYYQIVENIYVFTTIFITAYCYALLVKPFLSDKSSGRALKSQAWVVAAVYSSIMLFLHYMPYYISVILAYGIGILGTFFVMCLLDPVYIRQKLFLSITFFVCAGRHGALWDSRYLSGQGYYIGLFPARMRWSGSGFLS